MEEKQPGLMTPFDEMTIPKQLRFIKLLLPFFPPSNQQMLGILIKFLELQHTIQIFQHTSDFLRSSQNSSIDFKHPMHLFETLAPYLSNEELQTANTFRTVLNMMEIMQTFSSMNETQENTASNIPMEIIFGMLSPEQQELFQNYQTIFSDFSPESPSD